jgi:hypothetical protein
MNMAYKTPPDCFTEFRLPCNILLTKTFDEALIAVATGNPIGIEGASFPTTKQFIVNNIGVLGVDQSGRAFHDFEIPRHAEVVHNFKSDIKFDFFIGNDLVSSKRVNSILLFLSVYTCIKVRFYITSETKSFQCQYMITLLKERDFKHRCLYHDTLLYRDGCCSPLEEM